MPLTASQALQDAYTLTDEVILRTVSIVPQNPAHGAPVHLIGGYFGAETVNLKDENGVPITYRAASLDFGFSPRKGTVLKNLQITLNVPLEEINIYRDTLNKIAAARSTAFVDYREYLEGNQLPEIAAIRLSLLSATYKAPQMTLQAGFEEVLNRRFPLNEYNSSLFPGLRTYG